MCGRYTITLDLDTILAQLNLELPDFGFEARFNIAPTQRLPVITSDDPHGLQLFKWGLVPFWAKNPAIGNKMINARGETVDSKPAFRSAFKSRRCLAIADGFYEWKKSPTGKIPHHIHLKSREAFTIAGLWESWEDPEGKPLRTFTLITTTPNALMADIHDRMPVIIGPQDRALWLDPEASPEALKALIKPLEDGLLEADPVSTKVNSPRNEGPELLSPPDTLF